MRNFQDWFVRNEIVVVRAQIQTINKPRFSGANLRTKVGTTLNKPIYKAPTDILQRAIYPIGEEITLLTNLLVFNKFVLETRYDTHFWLSEDLGAYDFQPGDQIAFAAKIYHYYKGRPGEQKDLDFGFNIFNIPQIMNPEEQAAYQRDVQSFN